MEKNISGAEKRRKSSETKAKKTKRRKLGLQQLSEKNDLEVVPKKPIKKQISDMPVEVVKNLQMILNSSDSGGVIEEYAPSKDLFEKPLNISIKYNEDLYRKFVFYEMQANKNYRFVV